MNDKLPEQPKAPETPAPDRAQQENEEFKRQARRGWNGIRERQRQREDEGSTHSPDR